MAAGAVSGFTYGVVYDITKNPGAAGAASGAAGDAFTQTWDIVAGTRSGYDLAELGEATALGFGTGLIGDRIGSRIGDRIGAKFGPKGPAATPEPGGDPDTWNFPRSDSDVPPTGRTIGGGEPATSLDEPIGQVDDGNEPVNYNRPSKFRTGIRDKAWGNAREPSTGQVRDPLTGRFMSPNRPWQMGHRPGYEFWKLQDYAADTNMSRPDFRNLYNNPDYYRPELPVSNMSHRGEGPIWLNHYLD